MSKLTKDMIDGFRKNAKVFQAIIDAADVLEQVSSIDNAVSESQARLVASKADEASVLTGIETLKAEIKALTSKKSDAQVRADKLVTEAEGVAAGIVANAKIAAQSVVDTANRNVAKIIADAEARAQSLDFKTAEAQKQLDAINAEIAEKAKEKTALQKAVDAIKSKFA